MLTFLILATYFEIKHYEYIDRQQPIYLIKQLFTYKKLQKCFQMHIHLSVNISLAMFSEQEKS